MPRRSKGARLYLRDAVTDPKTGAVLENAVWVIRDGSKSRRTGCAPGEVEHAEQALAAYIQARHQPDRARDRDPDHIEISDVLSIYIDDVVHRHARPKESRGRIAALERYWGGRKLSEVSGRTCRDYAKKRGSPAAARRELEELRAAINHHRREGLCSQLVEVVLPERGGSRERWLTPLRGRPAAVGRLSVPRGAEGRRDGEAQPAPHRPVRPGGALHRHPRGRDLRRLLRAWAGQGLDRPRRRRVLPPRRGRAGDEEADAAHPHPGPAPGPPAALEGARHRDQLRGRVRRRARDPDHQGVQRRGPRGRAERGLPRRGSACRPTSARPSAT